MKKLLLTLLAAAVTLAAAAGGISSAAELAAFAEAVNAGGDIAAWQDERGEVHLKADIDMSGIKRFARIGNFEGVFDGEGHAILNWKTDGGLFRLVAEGSVVRNLVIAESCSMKVSDDGDDALYAGFVADVNHGILERCENYGSIAHRSARSLHDNYVGGVCGMNKYVVIRCKNGGDISSAGSCPSLAPTAEPRMYLGGVLGGSLGRSLPGAFVAWCENTGRVGYSGAFIVSHIGGICGFASYCDFAGNENLGSVEGGGALLGGIVAAFENGSVRGCTNRGDVLAGSKGQAGGIAATTWNGGNSRIESCRNGGVVKGMFGLAGSILGEGRTESDRVASCGVGGGVGTAAQGRDAAPKAAPENFDQFITGRNVVKNKAVVDRASCYYWDGNN